MLLGIIVRRVSGRFYGDVVKDRVFVPLGMTTARIISEEDIVLHRVAGYRLVNGELKNQEWVAPKLNTTADGSLYLSVVDLEAWDRALRSRPLLTARSWDLILQPARPQAAIRCPTDSAGKSKTRTVIWFNAPVANGRGSPRTSRGTSTRT